MPHEDEKRENKFGIQDSQYEFPYHYIPHFDAKGMPRCTRQLTWGYEYLCYLIHAKEVVKDLSPSSVLEVGCGDGRFIGMLKDVAPRLVGADLSERAIGFARAFHPEIEFHSMDAAKLGERFDVVAAIEVLEHIPDDSVPDFLRMMFDRACPGGYVLISVPSTVLPLNVKHYRHYDEALLRSQLKACGAPHHILEFHHVYSEPKFARVYRRLTTNRYWSFEFHPLRKWVWRHIWKQRRFAPKGKGHHLLVLAQKPSS